MLLQRPVLSFRCPSDGQTRRGWRRGRIHIVGALLSTCHLACHRGMLFLVITTRPTVQNIRDKTHLIMTDLLGLLASWQVVVSSPPRPFSLPRSFSPRPTSAKQMSTLDKKLSCRRDCTMLRATEYFAKSLKVIRNDTLQHDVSLCLYLVSFVRYSASNIWREL